LEANYALAVDSFEEYLRLFPDSSLADNAQYWIGESHYARQQYQLARTAFLDLARRWPQAETVADAKFKAARCLVELGDGARAVDELVRLVREHPRSETVPIACMQIERLGAELPLGCPGGQR
jgi:tol-pal system protein YbgF